MRERAHGHDAHVRVRDLSSGLQEGGEQELGEEEVTHVVGPQLDLEPFLGHSGRIGHGPRVQDQAVETVTFPLELLGSGADRLKGREIEGDMSDVDGRWNGFSNRFDGFLRLGGTPCANVDARRTMVGELDDRFFSQTGISCAGGPISIPQSQRPGREKSEIKNQSINKKINK